MKQAITGETFSLKRHAPARLRAAADDNFVARAGWAQRRVAGLRVLEAFDLVLIDSGLPCYTFNLICRARMEQGAAAGRARWAVDYFVERGRPFSWWLSSWDRPGKWA